VSAVRVRKLVRFLHLAFNGTWLGAVGSCLLLVRAGTPGDPAPYLAAFWLHDNVVVWIAAVVLFTGLYFSLYTPWGLFRKWWVLIKWIGLAVLGLGIPFVVTPAINALAAHADVSMSLGTTGVDLDQLERRSLVLLGIEAVAILALFALSTWRPTWETGVRWEEGRFARPIAMVLSLAVAGTSVATAVWLERARRTPIESTAAEGVSDGSHRAAIDWLGVEVAVEVDVRHGRISELRIVEQPTGRYPELAALVARKVESAGHLEVDGISGATTSARGILVAASRALAEPGAEASSGDGIREEAASLTKPLIHDEKPVGSDP